MLPHIHDPGKAPKLQITKYKLQASYKLQYQNYKHKPAKALGNLKGCFQFVIYF